jgi:RNA polymerase-associated protein LEO1
MQIRQSNSRVIRWSDGTLSLKLGKEIFDITQSVDVSAAAPRQSLGTSQGPASQSQSQSSGKSQGLIYLVAQHKRSQVLQAEALITGSMTLQPTGMQSDAHRLLVKAVGQKHNKKARLLLAPDPTFDPEREKMELMKAQAKKGTRRRFESSSRRRRTGRRQVHDFSDEEDADAIFGSDEEDDDDVVHSSGGRAPKRKRNDDENNKGGDYQEDDFVVADESDEDHDLGGSSRKKGKEVDVMADLDKLEAKIEKREGRRKQKGDDKSDDDAYDDDGDDDADDGMDVESEEEEEEFKVRRASGRRGRVMAEDEEDE